MKAKGIVLYFHQEEDGRQFERIILTLKRKYQLLSLPQLEKLLQSNADLSGTCHVSFDDGDHSFYRVVFPVLQKHQVPVSLFLSPIMLAPSANFWFRELEDYDEPVMKEIIAEQFGITGLKLKPFSITTIFKCFPFAIIEELIAAYQHRMKIVPKPSLNMSGDEVLEVERSGLVTIGAHTLHHPILQNEDEAGSLAEIKGSLLGLSQLLGHPVHYFAYPNGIPRIDFGEREKKVLRDNGVTMAFSTELDHVKPGVDLLSIPRMGFPRMGLAPENPLIYIRLGLGKKWVDIRSLGGTSREKVRERIRDLLDGKWKG